MFTGSKVLVKFTGIFLILYISATSATPTGQPGEAQNINDDIHARAPPGRPPYHPYQCLYPYAWMRRECVGLISPQAWQDVCGIANYHTGFKTVYDNQPGACPSGTICLDGFNNVRQKFITCVMDSKNKGKQKVDPQAGVSEPKRARVELANTQLKYSVTIDHDMTGAAVAAVVKSDDGSFLIAPNNVIVGNVHGKIQQVCSGDKSDPAKARECYPNGTYDFTTGQVIDFTWGMTSEQEGKLVYGIVPALPPV